MDGHYKAKDAKDEESCWNECEDELACNAVSFSKNISDENGENCYLFTSVDAKRQDDVEFVSILRKSLGNWYNEMIV